MSLFSSHVSNPTINWISQVNPVREQYICRYPIKDPHSGTSIKPDT